MERVITVTLHVDSDGNQALSLHPQTTIVSVVDEEGDPVNIRWILQEESPHPPTARKLTVTFTRLPTPFNDSGVATPVESYVAYVGPSGVATDTVLETAVGSNENAVRLYKYNVEVETTENKTVKLVNLDPDISVRRRKITKDTILGY
jgi:hypothetical protein